MNWANRITLIRIFLIPVIIALMVIVPFKNSSLYNGWDQWLTIKGDNVTYSLPISYLIAGILFIIASLTDLLDGFIARLYNQVTTFGKFFDSIADKLLTNTVLIVFACANIIPVWMVVLLIARDFVIDVVRQILATQKVVMAANQLGRVRAAMEMFGMTVLFFIGFRMFNGHSLQTGQWDEFGWVNQIIMIPIYLATVLSLAAAGNYIFLNRKILFDMTVIKKPKLENGQDNNEKNK
ncbi:CDP-diacylglycerol--glycerol-3-phosphate 3-phosphatidyltransferase [Spiroplasma citri]|uniref:CDP-diacylglycerol--glycerol-3-phosphate 3-phosphatidyltransferase n=1 Tax=Spiroplasma citri TaxID=2133 RepID=A0AAJ4JYA4_SPICI|nr:CDP-diacylglycerol--glycerol-3-phosphate 3-phosphatidyltransferase [Spiroplasma citri]APE74815.1 CDP-diacylglycerol--glycerol-3-phosphate 3-phosphatidyltransferase [Spiroplasma citri]QED24739.1 CDP-diacylglycerol--glycerol-3-phosphate 3-phosphatidyltransferase [Spiroplasma citri]QIA67059.1 CDP-diacylglycerol--glycerol-3-phosphate 3-phosphatidyltransferase [Spiroplasma citri]QIA68923.1 CDP-diacylglycerol--glycerol-3-phosphate 3-phosphatidyltransferase [Spiroplasma citri]QIA70785.1 CDP-diacyl